MASWHVGSLWMTGQHSAVAPAKYPARDLRLRTADGLAIAASFRPGLHDRAPAILLLHPAHGSRASTADTAAWLSRLGYATLAIDFRGHGESDQANRTFGVREALDARAAFDWLKRHQHGAPVAVIGISLGGAASLIGDAGPLPADAMILQAVYPDIRQAVRNRIAQRLSAAPAYLLEPLLSLQLPLRYGLWPSRFSPREALGRYPGPVLVIGGLQDSASTPADSRALAAAAAGPHSLWLVPVGDHAEMVSLNSPAYRHRIRTFLEKTMPRP
ncbi:hypothetical protein WP12_15650 [Sphingomonas sp. SRS2]|nr:hypothetical protein WP12_15650 [Sphingomonas sp. SRS2]